MISSGINTLRKKAFLQRSSIVGFRICPQRFESNRIEKTEQPIVLYERDSKRLKIQRGAMAVSAFHTGYWIWYNCDFIPVVNQSPIEQFQIHPLIGLIGLITAVFGQTIVVLYSSRLISKLEYYGDTNDISVYNHHIPFMIPSKKGKRFPIGSLKLNVTPEQLYSIPLETSTISILKETNNYNGFANYIRLPMLLDIQEQDKLDTTRIIPALVNDKVMNPPHNNPPTKAVMKKRKKPVWKVDAVVKNGQSKSN
jgi:hypothetical protein